MGRARNLGTRASLIMALGMALAGCAPEHDESANRSGGTHLPSILLICSDTHRFDYSLGEGGAALMPRLAALKQGAVFYRYAWSNASWTLPAVASALTGLFPRYHRTGHRVATRPMPANGEPWVAPGLFAAPWGNIYSEITAFPERLETIFGLLERSGYTTALVSANPFYHLSGLAQAGRTSVVHAVGQPGHRVNAEVEELLGQLDGKDPLFLTVHYMDLHDYDTLEFLPRHPNSSLYDADRKELRDSYARTASRFDRNLGELLDRWDEKIGLRASLVIFYADHGEHLFDSGHPRIDEEMKRLDPSLPEDYRRLAVPVLNHGNSMQESLLRIPLLIKYPAALGLAGRVVEAEASLVDLVPTVLDVLGIEPETVRQPLQGRSLLEIARYPTPEQRLIFADYQLYGDPLTSVRKGRYKLILNHADGSTRLVETCVTCRPDGEPGRVLEGTELEGQLRAALRSHIEAAGTKEDLPSTWSVPTDEVVEQLRALGYAR